MRPPERPRAGVVGEWLAKAKDDMDVAEYLLASGGVFPRAITFHCQQAAEKFIKAFLTSLSIHFPKTHDLRELLELIASANRDLSGQLHDVIALTPYATELRYPGDQPPITDEEARDAVALARKVRDAVLPLLRDTV